MSKYKQSNKYIQLECYYIMFRADDYAEGVHYPIESLSLVSLSSLDHPTLSLVSLIFGSLPAPSRMSTHPPLAILRKPTIAPTTSILVLSPSLQKLPTNFFATLDHTSEFCYGNTGLNGVGCELVRALLVVDTVEEAG